MATLHAAGSTKGAISTGLGINLPYSLTSIDTGRSAESERESQDFSGSGHSSSCNLPGLMQQTEPNLSVCIPVEVEVLEKAMRYSLVSNCSLGVETGGSMTSHHITSSSSGSAEESTLSRQGTLLTVGATPARNAAELKSILGNANAKLKAGAILPPTSHQHLGHQIGSVKLEQAKRRPRVQVDIILASNCCVQGGYLHGEIKIRVRKRSKKEHPVMVSGGKVRVIGFECIMHESQRYAFYQCTASLAESSQGLGQIFDSLPDVDDFRKVKEGNFVLPFALHLPLSSDNGTPKGSSQTQLGVSVRYIAIVSLRVKDSVSEKKSVSHFYRDCIVWPRLNPSVIFAPLPRPIQVTVSDALFMGGSGKVKLTASLHRLHWTAGQLCQAKVSVLNDTKKYMKSLTLSLHQSTIVYKSRERSGITTASKGRSVGSDPLQAVTTTKQVAESTLTMSVLPSRGRAGTKEWWAGVGPGESLTFFHSILIPVRPDALSVSRGKLLEVDYNLRIALNSGILPAGDVHVTLPIRIINLLSVDPPPSSLLIFKTQAEVARVPFSTLSESSFPNRQLEDLDDPREHIEDRCSEAGPGPEFSDCDSDEGCSEDDEDEDSDYDDFSNNSYHDDNDDVVQHAIATHGDPELSEEAPRFADLYYASLQNNAYETVPISWEPEIAHGEEPNLEGQTNVTTTRPLRPKGPTNFERRVQEKKRQAKEIARNGQGNLPFIGHNLSSEGRSWTGDAPVTQGTSETPMILVDSSHSDFHSRSILGCNGLLPHAASSVMVSVSTLTKPPRSRTLPTPPVSQHRDPQELQHTSGGLSISLNNLDAVTGISQPRGIELEHGPTATKSDLLTSRTRAVGTPSVKDKIKELEARVRALSS